MSRLYDRFGFPTNDGRTALLALTFASTPKAKHPWKAFREKESDEEAEDELTAKEMRSFAWLEWQRGAPAISRGRCEKARAHYQRAATAFSGHWQTDAHLAELFVAEGNLDEAFTENAGADGIKKMLGILLTK